MASKTDSANPAALGLVGFGMTTVLLSLVNAGVLSSAGDNVVVPLALAYGGAIQIIAGILEYQLGNTFGMTAFLSYGAFWWWFALMTIFGKAGILPLQGAGEAVGVALLLWGVFTMYLWVGTFRLSRALWLVFFTLWVTFYLLGLGALSGLAWLTRLGGWLGVICGALAMYTSFAEVTNFCFGRPTIPTGRPIAHEPDVGQAQMAK